MDLFLVTPGNTSEPSRYLAAKEFDAAIARAAHLFGPTVQVKLFGHIVDGYVVPYPSPLPIGLFEMYS